MIPETADFRDAQTFQTELMAPEPMRRAVALHALELELEAASAVGAERGLAHQVEAFAARGIPYYSPEDTHYRDWVGKAVAYWQRLHGRTAAA